MQPYQPTVSADKSTMWSRGDFLARRLDEVGVHRTRLALELGYKSDAMVHHFCKGTRTIPLDLVPKVAEILKLDVKSTVAKALFEEASHAYAALFGKKSAENFRHSVNEEKNPDHNEHLSQLTGYFEAVPADKQQLILSMARSLAETSNLIGAR